MKSNNITIPAWLAGIPLVIILTIVVAINKGFAVSMTWELFMPSVFGLPHLDIPLAIAVTALATLIFPSHNDFKKDDREIKLGLYLFVLFINPWVIYLIALIATKFYF